MKNVSVFLRRFLLLVFYANISTTSSFHLEEGKQPKIMSPVAKERWSGPSRTQGQAELTISGRKHSDVTQGDLLPMTASFRLKPRRLVRREDEDYQRDQGKEDDEGEEEEEDKDEDEDEDRQSQTDSRHHFSRECRKQLNLDIESCLSGYESMLRNMNPNDQLNDSFKLELCHEYEKTMQCLHLSFALCRPGHLHLQLIAYRLGYLRTFMEQTCDQLDKADGTDESEQVAVEDDESDSPPPPPQPTNAYLTQMVTVNRVPMERQDVGGATTRAISSVAMLRSDVATSIVVPSDSSKPKTLIEPSSSSSVSSSASSSHSTKLRVTSSSAHQSVAFDATSSRPRMTSEHVLNGGGTECSGAFACGGRAPDVDGQQRLQLQNSSLQHPTTTSSTAILASIFPVVRSTLPSRYNGGLTPDPAATVALQSPFHPSSSRGEIIQAGALATASSSFGGTKPTQCHPEVTCSRANSMGYGSRSYSLDLCLVLYAILLLKRRVNICHSD